MDFNKVIQEAQKLSNDSNSSVKIEITISPKNKNATWSHLNSDSSKGNVPPSRIAVNTHSLSKASDAPPPPPPPGIRVIRESGCLIYVLAGITSVIGTFYWIL